MLPDDTSYLLSGVCCHDADYNCNELREMDMTVQVLRLPDNASWWERNRHTLLDTPLHAFKTNGNQAFITSAAVYAGAMFGMQHNVFPWWIAVPLAGGFEWTYLAGIALASDTRKAGWSVAISATGALTSIAFGMLYILGMYKVIPENPDQELAIWLAAAHIIPITLMSFFYAMAHRAHHAQRLTDEESERIRKRTKEDEQSARIAKWQDDKSEIELNRMRLELEAMRNKIARGSTSPVAATTKPCPKCTAPLSPGQYSVAHRYGYCAHCKGK